VLQNILQESTDFDQSKIHQIVDRARGLQEDEVPDIPVDTGEINNKDLETLKDAIRSVSGKYARYLKILSLFDPNALGTLSEVLLAKLLDSLDHIKSVHTGGAQTLDDLRVNGKPLSLKTSLGDSAIPLGSDSINIIDKSIQLVKDFILQNQDKNNPKTFEQLVQIDPDNDSDEIQRAKQAMNQRIVSISTKMAGENDDHFFVWAEKVRSGKKMPIEGIRIHVYKYNTAELIEFFKKGYPYTTKVGWGVREDYNNPSSYWINTDKEMKYLNVQPNAIRTLRPKAETTYIPFDIQLTDETTKITPQQLVSTEVLKVLDLLSKKLFGK
jgi:hypothetical protein